MQLPIGSILLVVVAVLIYFGLAERVLDRMRLTDRTALGFLLLIILGSFLNIPVARNPELIVNVGGALVPLALVIYLIAGADTSRERGRAVLGAFTTGAAVYGLGKLMTAGPEAVSYIDPTYVFGIVAAVVAYLSGRSRRGAFVAGTMGIIIADLATHGEMLIRRVPGRTWLGGAGAFDATIVAGVLAVLLAEIVGETRERLQGGPRGGEHRERRLGTPGKDGDSHD